jgi:hypothetical protein
VASCKLVAQIALVALLAAPHCPAPRVVTFEAPSHASTWERFEVLGFAWHGAANPYDPAAVDLRGEFEAPDGERFEMPGFVTKEYARELVGGFEKRRATSAAHWRVRFTPIRPGTWRWRWLLSTPAGDDATPWQELEVDPPAPGRHGFLRVSALDSRYLRFDDGTPFFALGENLAWYDGRGTFAYDDWFAKLSREGVNYVRLWMPSWAFGIEWLRREGDAVVSSLGDYEDRLDRAWQLDRVLEAAEAHGIYVMLTIQNHGPFSLDANTQWADNPYNVENGGLLDHPLGFFSDEAARELFRRRLRYVVARWGSSTHLLAWELWNEVNLVANAFDPAVVAWHQEMARELLALDPHDHLISTSVSLGAEQSPLWDLPEIAFTQTHTYNWPLLMDTATLLATLSARARVPGKPTLIAETGADFRGPAETLATDPNHIGFHDGLWVGVMAETFGTGMSWWWDNVIDPQDLYGHFGAVARFVEGVAFDEQGFVAARPTVTAPARDLTAWALVGPSVVLVWIKNLDHQFFPAEASEGDPLPVDGALLTLAGLGDGSWRARWLDAYTGAELAAVGLVVEAGAAALPVPSFVGDVALRLERPEPD